MGQELEERDRKSAVALGDVPGSSVVLLLSLSGPARAPTARPHHLTSGILNKLLQSWEGPSLSSALS